MDIDVATRQLSVGLFERLTEPGLGRDSEEISPFPLPLGQFRPTFSMAVGGIPRQPSYLVPESPFPNHTF